ncbi:(R)-mandelonitrile lyase [Sporichthya polymorpha]|uniref:(R)-mandelonitrile lyase n=1 Tax=Sporichthya polymorpha TaxID=35751 RepID=UPI00037A5F26|nr:cupin domain-containing protein [Sporichthya polymorpha]
MTSPYNAPSGSTARGPESWFRGDVFVDSLVAGDNTPGSIAMLKVRFAPGARTHWHSHPAGQALHVVDGVGRTQDRGGPVREIRNGDSVDVRPGVWHWHGAGPDTFMTHIAVQIGDHDGVYTVWGDPVTDEEYLGRLP